MLELGQPLKEARCSADNVDLTVTVDNREPCSDQPKDHICEQSPVDGELDKGQAVSVTVSTGAPKIEMPDVTDKDEDDAGTVLKQDPDGGEEVEKGSEVTLTVAKAPEQAVIHERRLGAV
ncbi:PASTA domain-containing protein [Streptomyces albogriseolus]|uniref:PASTA domain-containing protein n=1 Tax=Streptomyces albogriseolus TaxID=1887 RepID=UPI0038126F56